MFRASFLASIHVLILITTASLATAQTTRPADQPLKGKLLDGVTNQTHPVSTQNAEAQKFFDQGMCLMYGFNHDEAMRSFIAAAELDPKLAMAHWGIAATLGPNYNVPVDPAREVAAYDEIHKAMDLAANASDAERDYINALAKRYSNDPKADLQQLNVEYRNAMRDLVRKHPDDLDAATLYAESIMMLRPWKLWTHDGTPAEDTPELLSVLESVMSRNPDHIGANHLYIHAVEASRHPERALEAAGRLPTLVPASGHLVHMPSHIYARVGDFDSASTSNVAAVLADEAYLKDRDDHGVYGMMYYNHNIHFIAYANMMQGRFSDAITAANKLHDHAAPHVAHMQMLEIFAIMPETVLARFGKWDDILAIPEPPPSHQISQMSWHLTRGLAYAARGDSERAETERAAVAKIAANVPAESMYGMLNPASLVAPLADHYLAGRIAMARHDVGAAIESFTRAVDDEDKLNYDEPATWWFSTREALGGALLKAGKPADAEAVFRRGLEYSPRNGRALLGLMESLRAQGKTYDAQWVEQEFKAAWKNADTQIGVQDL